MIGLRIDHDRLKGSASGKGTQLAQHLGIHQTTLSRKLNGKMSLTLDELNETAKFLKHDTKYFLMEFDMNGAQA